MSDTIHSLIKASYEGDLCTVKKLIGAVLDTPSSYNHYVMRAAVSKGHLNIVKYLVNAGVDITIERNDAIRWACRWGHLDTAKYLIGIGADPMVDDGQTIEWTGRYGYPLVKKYLIDLILNEMKKYVLLLMLNNYKVINNDLVAMVVKSLTRYKKYYRTFQK